MLISRRTALSAAVFWDLAAAIARAQTQSGGPTQTGPTQIFKHDLPNIPLEDWEVTISHVDYAPGRVGQSHQHRGFLFAYVLEGAVVAQVLGEGVSHEVRTYKVGEVFYEPIGATHHVSKNASDTLPARLLVVNLAKKGAQ